VPHPAVTLDAFRKQVQTRYGERAAGFLELYAAGSDEAARVASNASSRDQARVGTYLWAVQRGKTSKSKTFTYFWDHVLPGPDAAQYGAFHTSEVPYVLNTLAQSDRPFTDADRHIAEKLSSYWANFAAHGDPNGKGLPHWPAAGGKPEVTMEVGDVFAPIPVADSAEKLQFLTAFLLRPRSS
jgi:carboxylesterase type B